MKYLLTSIFLAITWYTGTLSGQIPTDYVAYYPFNGNANDESGNGNNGTTNGVASITDRSGNANSAYDFDGIDDYISLTGLTSSSKSYSFSMWVKASDPNNDFLYLFDSEFDRFVLGWQGQTAGQIGFYDGTWYNFGSTPNDGTWKHLVYVFDNSNNQAKLYVNGSQYGTSKSYVGKDIGGRVNIGTVYRADGSFFKGSIDDIVIYNRVLTTSEIQSIYNDGGSPPPGIPSTGLIAYYPFNNNADDESGSGNNGTTNGVASITDRSGNANSAYDFDGIDDYISLTGLTSSSKSYSFSMWVKASDPNNDFLYLFDSEFDRFVLGWQGQTAGQIGFYDGTWYNFGSTPNDGTWKHLVYVFDNSNNQAKLYVNGSQYGTSKSYLGKNIGGRVNIGTVYRADGSFFKGSIDDIVIYSRVLTTSEINQLFTVIGAAPTCSDGQQNGDETGVDCGGSCPTACPIGGPSLWTQSGTNIYYNTSGNVGIGIINPPAKLTVDGVGLFTQIKVKTDVSTFPDFVFEPDYPLMTITEVDNYIQTHGHLPDMPDAQEAVTNGHDIGAMNLKLLQKIEELTLYAIEQEDAIRKQEKAYGELRTAYSDLKISNDERDQKVNNLQLITQDLAYKIILLNK